MKAPYPYCQICYERAQKNKSWARKLFEALFLPLHMTDPRLSRDFDMECIDKWSNKFKCPRCGTVQIYLEKK